MGEKSILKLYIDMVIKHVLVLLYGVKQYSLDVTHYNNTL